MSYVPSNGSTIADVQPCPPHTRVVNPTIERGEMVLQTADGASSIEQCLCEPGHYRPLSAAISDGCIECPSGAVCLGAQMQPFAQRGYGKITNSSSSFLECTQNSCQGGSITFTEDTSVVHGFTFVHNEYMCELGFQQGSALCSRCAP